MSDIDKFKEETEKSVEALRKMVIDQITVESELLIKELLSIAYNPEADSRVKLQAISMLLDRAVPKMGVDHAKVEDDPENHNRRRLREEVEALLMEDSDEEEES